MYLHGILAAISLSILFACAKQSETTPSSDAAPALPTPTYDSTYAAQLGADAYGMRKYVLVLLRNGPTRDQDSLTAARLQRTHLDNMTRWAEDGLLVAAGPTYNTDSDLRGLYVFALESVAEVEALAAEDPAVAAGRLVLDAYPWYSSAALMDVNRIHEQISKEGI